MDPAWYIAVALALDLVVGDPRWLPHPVRGMGRLASLAKRRARRWIPHPRAAGVVTVIVVVGTSVFVAIGLLELAAAVHPRARDVMAVLLIYYSIAARDLIDHSGRVCRALVAGDLVAARGYVGMMVGRDTDHLSEEEVTRAAVESVAEGTVDGVTAPLFYAVLLGPVGAIGYRTINTLDSMFGYPRYGTFGCPAARLDDAANFIPARLTMPLVWLATVLLGERTGGAVRIGLRDRRNHASPNAAHGEATYAGALGVRLGGLDYHRGEPRRKPNLGEPSEPLEPTHITRANRLLVVTTLLAAAAGTVIGMI